MASLAGASTKILDEINELIKAGKKIPDAMRDTAERIGAKNAVKVIDEHNAGKVVVGAEKAAVKTEKKAPVKKESVAEAKTSPETIDELKKSYKTGGGEGLMKTIKKRQGLETPAEDAVPKTESQKLANLKQQVKATTEVPKAETSTNAPAVPAKVKELTSKAGSPTDSVELENGQTLTRAKFLNMGGTSEEFDKIVQGRRSYGQVQMDDSYNVKNIKEADTKIADVDKQIAERKAKAERLSKKKPQFRQEEANLKREKAQNDAELAKLQEQKSNLSGQKEEVASKTSPEALSKLQQTAKQNSDFVGPPKAGEEPTSSPLPPGPVYKETLVKGAAGNFKRADTDYATFNKQTGFETKLNEGLYNVKFVKESGEALPPEQVVELKKGIVAAQKQGSAGIAKYAKGLAAGGILLGVGNQFLKPTEEAVQKVEPQKVTPPTPAPAISADFPTSEKLKQLQELDKQLGDPNRSSEAKATLQSAKDRILSTIPENERPASPAKVVTEPTEEQIKTDEDKRVALFKQGIFGPETSGTAQPYEAENPGSSAVGKYQFLWNTWGNSIGEFAGNPNLTKEEYKANPELQEKWMDNYARNLLPDQANTLLSKFTPEQLQQRGITNNLELMALLHYQGPNGAAYYLEKGEMYPWKDRDGNPVKNLPVEDYISKFRKFAEATEGTKEFNKFEQFKTRKQKTAGARIGVDGPEDLLNVWNKIQEVATPMAQLDKPTQERLKGQEDSLTAAIKDATASYNESIKTAKDEAARREAIAAWGQIFETLGQAAIKYFAAREGKRLGQRIGSNLQLEKHDWSSDLNRSMKKLEIDMAQAKEKFGIAREEVEAGRKALSKEREGLQERAYKRADMFLKASLDERERAQTEAARAKMNAEERAFKQQQNAAEMANALKLKQMELDARVTAAKTKASTNDRKKLEAAEQSYSKSSILFDNWYDAKSKNKELRQKEFANASAGLGLTPEETAELSRLSEGPGWFSSKENKATARGILQEAYSRKVKSYLGEEEAPAEVEQMVDMVSPKGDKLRVPASEVKALEAKGARRQ